MEAEDFSFEEIDAGNVFYVGSAEKLLLFSVIAVYRNIYCNQVQEKKIRKCPKCFHLGRGLTLVTKSPTDLKPEIKINNQGCTNAI